MSRLDRIYIARHLHPLTYDWKLEPSLVPTDHWPVKVKYAPLDAPFIGKGQWTWPLHSLNNKRLLEAVSERGLKLQEDLACLSTHNIERSTSNPQLLWNKCKKDFSMIAKKHMRDSYHKISTRIKHLEKDRKQLTEHPNFEVDNDLRVREAILANELDHLGKAKACQHHDLFKARMTDHGEKLGGIWTNLSKASKPQDLIYCLKVPNSNPPQYERDSHRMAELSRNFHNDLQSEDLTHFRDQEDHDHNLCKVLDAIPASQQLSEPHLTEMNWSAMEVQVAKAIELGKNKTATGLDGCPYELWQALEAGLVIRA